MSSYIITGSADNKELAKVKLHFITVWIHLKLGEAFCKYYYQASKLMGRPS